MSFSPTVTWLCHGHVFFCLAFYLLLRRFFARSPRIDPVRLSRFLSSWNSEESNFSGLVEGLIRVKNKFWIFEHDEFSFLEIQLEILENFRWDKGNDSREGLLHQRRCNKIAREDRYIRVIFANYGYPLVVSILIEQVRAIKRKSYERTLIELIESSGFRGWHEFNEDS